MPIRPWNASPAPQATEPTLETPAQGALESTPPRPHATLGNRPVAEPGSSSRAPRAALASLPGKTTQPQFVWPDGQASTGQPVPGCVANKPVHHFMLDLNDPVLSQGKHRAAHDQTSPDTALVRARKHPDGTFSAVMPHLTDIGLTTTGLFSRTEKLADLKLPVPVFDASVAPSEERLAAYRVPLSKRTVTLQDLAEIVRTASGHSALLPVEQRGVVCALFARALDHLVDTRQAHNGAAVASAARALEGTQHLVLDLRDQGRIESTFDAAELMQAANALPPGGHLHVAISMRSKFGHALGLAVSRRPDGTQDFDVSILNSLGWQGKSDAPVLTKRVAPSELQRTLPMMMSDSPALQNPWAGALHDSASPAVPLPSGEDLLNLIASTGNLGKAMEWSQPKHGNPLLAWLTEHVAPDQEASPGPGGREIRQPAQKANDCGVESAFVFLATTLDPADYKLAKASCLATLQGIADHLTREGVASMHGVADRLAQRQTSALRGYAQAHP